MMINPITPAIIRKMITGGACALLDVGDAIGDGEAEACCALTGVWAGAFHCEAGTNENPSSTKKGMRRNDTNTAPIAPEV